MDLGYTDDTWEDGSSFLPPTMERREKGTENLGQGMEVFLFIIKTEEEDLNFASSFLLHLGR